MHDNFGYGYHGADHRILFLLLVVLFVVAAGAAVALLLRQRQAPTTAPGQPPGESGAMRILDERFARGEIDDEEYHRRRAVLRSTS